MLATSSLISHVIPRLSLLPVSKLIFCFRFEDKKNSLYRWHSFWMTYVEVNAAFKNSFRNASINRSFVVNCIARRSILFCRMNSIVGRNVLSCCQRINIDSVIAFRFNIENIDRIANIVSDDVCNRVTMLKELLQCRDGMLCLSDDSFSSNDVEQLLSLLCTSLVIALFYFYFLIFFIFYYFFPLLNLFWMLVDTMFARDMYQVYEINDDWLEQ